VVQTGHFEKFLKIVLQLPRLALEVTLDDREILLAGVINFLVVIIIADSDCNALGHRFCPLLLPLAPFLALLSVALDHATWLLLLAAFTLPKTKAAPTTSSPEACQMVRSSSSLVVLN
jgi:hypothetical protein